MESDHAQLWKEVWKGLYYEMPIRGLPDATGTKLLRDDIHEFIFGRLPGIAFRVLWFEGDGPKEVICSNAFRKHLGASTPDSAIDQAKWHRKKFLADLSKGQVNRLEMRPSEL